MAALPLDRDAQPLHSPSQFIKTQMKKILSLIIRSGLVMACLLLVAHAARAGGAVVPFRQTWTVRWATANDSVKFDKFLDDGTAAEAGECDIAHCIACKVRDVRTATELAFEDCPLHAADATHQCTGYGNWSRLPTEVHGADEKSAAVHVECAFNRCLHCRGNALGLEPKSNRVCSHHAGGAVHYCHGVTVTTTHYIDANPALRFPGLQDTLLQNWHPAPATIDLDHAQTLSPVMRLQQVTEGNGTSVGGLAASKGVFMAHFEAATQFPILIEIQTAAGASILEHHADTSTQAFDLASFPAGTYKISARNAKGEWWVGFVDLQTGNPPNLNINFGF